MKVSILCSTYNHKDYISQAIDSFLMQKTNFKFEVLINDDHSTDGTTQIVKNYAKKYPDIVKPVFHKENQFSKGVRNMMVRFLLPKAKGQYIALCEGDDYWTDPDKLQKQVDFLDKNSDYALCFHPVKVIYEDKSKKSEIFPAAKTNFTVGKLLQANFIQTNSVMFRRMEYDNFPLEVMPGDWYLHLYHAQFGKIGFINEGMSVYRRHPGGVWWDGREIWRKYGIARMELYRRLLLMYGKDKGYKEAIIKSVQHAINHIIELADTNTRNTLAKNYPEFTKQVLSAYERVIEKQQKHFVIEKGKLENQITKLTKEIRNEKAAHRQTKEQLSAVLSSKSFKIGNTVVRVPKKILAPIAPHRKRNELKQALKSVYNVKKNKAGLKIAIIARNGTKFPSSSAFLRLIAPLTYGNAREEVSIRLLPENSETVDGDIDICIIQRTAFSDLSTATKFVESAKRKNIKIVVDTDDNFAQLDKSHPQYELQASSVGALNFVKDKANRVWVSTDKLGLNYKSKRTIYRNSVDDRLWELQKRPILKTKKIKAVYMGTATHDEDFAMILPALEKINQKYNDKFELTVIGVASHLPEKRWLKVETPPPGATMYPYFVKWFMKQTQFDIGLAPLEDSDFNRAKSDIKILDYLCLGVLPVVSDIEPYKGKELNDFVIRVGYDSEDWFNALEDIIINRKKYARKKQTTLPKIQRFLEKKRSMKNISEAMLKEIKRLSES